MSQLHRRHLLGAALAGGVAATLVRPAEACTRVLFRAPDGTVITGRSMDWGEDMHSNMWLLPRGMKRDGMGGANTVRWESKYGSLIVSGYDIGTAEGMNEKGLASGGLWFGDVKYPDIKADDEVVNIMDVIGWILGNFEQLEVCKRIW